ncbi:alginate lyase family protein [Candidatus Marithrix sp. Canyon 246]|uniref:alginate lyase family protein n=1 Tax=Candidatus Marithrix sp. Canyon 246 TaxID=1827136 RepID=UPI001495EBE8|nr:alginate lyase family protein [Candidatus Marithrix sp. Canyon 246]
MPKKLAWYIKRFSVMSPHDVLHRVGEQFTLKKLYLNYLFNKRSYSYSIESFAFCSSAKSRLPILKWNFNADVLELSGSNTDRWPRKFFNSIPYRDGNPYGDIRVAWESARLQHLIENQSCEKQFLSWVKDNPPLLGIHYISVMECGLRILSVCYALDKMRDKLESPTETWNALLQLVESHATLIEKRLSLYSSAGNHTIAECVGLIYAAVLFPEFKAAKRWKKKGLSILEQEAARQILPDGGGLEQSFWYLLFITDLCGLTIKLLEHYDEVVPISINSAYIRATKFLNSFANSPKELPSIGDTDNGYALSPYLDISWNHNSSNTVCKTFDNSGYTLIQGKTFKLIFDHGSLGMSPSYGHGHADALSIILQVDGENILVDPGTYSYTGNWRHYFRSTKAHNTINIDNQDQASQETAFMWSKPFQCQLVHNDGKFLLAKHNGYQYISNIIHWRGIIYYPIGIFIIWDHITGEGSHNIELNWHCRLPIDLSIESSQSIQNIKTWQSNYYGHKQPINTIRASTTNQLPQTLITRINLNAAAAKININDDIEKFQEWIT